VNARISSEMRGCDLQRRFVSHGGLTPPALVLRCERLPAKNDFCDGPTNAGASKRATPIRRGRQPAVARVGVGNALATALPLTHGRPPSGACADCRCSRVQRRREGPTVVPTPAFRDFQSLCSRAGLPRGADAPPLLVNARISSEMRGCDLQRRFVSHGGLTAPALVLRCERLPAKKRFLRWANAHSQERRA
jgi:hypothetical protein